MTCTDSTKAAGIRARGRAALVHFIASTPQGDLYSVGSTRDPNTAYSVTVQGDRFDCTCTAALAGLPACWHRSAAMNHRASRAAFGLPVTPPTTGALTARLAPRRLPPRAEDAEQDRDDARQRLAILAMENDR